VAEAQSNLQAKRATDPGSAALEFGIQSQYIPQLNELYQGVRQQNMPGGQDLSNALTQMITQQLASPTAMTPEQQTATDAIRNRELQRAQEGIRTRQNLGGNLYGGRSQAAEARDIGNITQQYEATDYNRLMQQQQSAMQNALQQQGQFMGQQIPQFGYQSPVVNPNQQFSTAGGMYGADVQNQQFQQQQQAAQKSALYDAIGQIAIGKDWGSQLGTVMGSVA